MTDTQVPKPDKRHSPARPIESPETDPVYVPDVDIRENDGQVRLVADMPGVDQTSVNVNVENGVLTIEGQAHLDRPEGYELVGQEYGVGKYRREFSLSNAVSVEGIKARVRHGVLEVSVPKRNEAKTRKVQITA